VTRYVAFRASVQTLNSAYLSLERRAEAHLGSSYNHVLDLSEREAANSVDVANTLVGSPPDVVVSSDGLEDAQLTYELRRISEDLDDRWRRAIFALNPRNPDAARHFCTSARDHDLDSRNESAGRRRNRRNAGLRPNRPGKAHA
jgi:hypothetical protein